MKREEKGEQQIKRKDKKGEEKGEKGRQGRGQEKWCGNFEAQKGDKENSRKITNLARSGEAEEVSKRSWEMKTARERRKLVFRPGKSETISPRKSHGQFHRSPKICGIPLFRIQISL